MKKPSTKHTPAKSNSAPAFFPRSEDCKTVEELARDPRSLLRHAKATGRPLVITEDGTAKGVLMSLDAYEQLIHNLNLGWLLLEGEEDIRKGRTRAVEDWWKEFQRANGIPGSR